jgi:DNA primase
MKSLLDVLAENNIVTKDSTGGRKIGRCPFHTGDHTPSFTIYPGDTYYCFGCGAWGNPVKFLVDYKGMSEREAIEYTGGWYFREKASGVIKVKNVSETWRFLWMVADQYNQNLMANRGALEYLLRRGLTIDTIKNYLVGYTDGFVLNITTSHEAALGAEIGLIDKDGVESMAHRITIPNLLSSSMMADFMVGRTVVNNKVKYLGLRMPKPIIGLSSVQASPLIFLVEGQFDWLALKQWGYPAVTSGGTNISRANIASIKDKTIVIVPDYDPSGIGLEAADTLKNKIGNDKTFILDYSSLREGEEKLDISKLAEREGSEKQFAEILKEQLPWLGNLSNQTMQTFFQGLVRSTHFQSTWKPQV